MLMFPIKTKTKNLTKKLAQHGEKSLQLLVCCLPTLSKFFFLPRETFKKCAHHLH